MPGVSSFLRLPGTASAGINWASCAVRNASGAGRDCSLNAGCDSDARPGGHAYVSSIPRVSRASTRIPPCKVGAGGGLFRRPAVGCAYRMAELERARLDTPAAATAGWRRCTTGWPSSTTNTSSGCWPRSANRPGGCLLRHLACLSTGDRPVPGPRRAALLLALGGGTEHPWAGPSRPFLRPNRPPVAAWPRTKSRPSGAAARSGG
jgi:hypothetical protein